MGHSYAGDAMLWQLIYSCDVSQSVKEIVFWELTEWLRRTHLSKKVKLSCTQRSFSSHLTDSLYTVRNKLLEKYIGILGRVNHCGFMALVAFSLASHCSGWTLGCFSVAHQHHYPNVKTSTDIYASQELHNIHGCYVQTSLHYADTLDCLVYFFFPSLHRSPCTIWSGLVPVYNRIWPGSHVRYDLDAFWCTISILEPHILRYLVLGELRFPST